MSVKLLLKIAAFFAAAFVANGFIAIAAANEKASVAAGWSLAFCGVTAAVTAVIYGTTAIKVVGFIFLAFLSYVIFELA